MIVHTNKTIEQLHKKLIGGEITSAELTKNFISYIKETNPRLNSFITVCEKEALLAAAKADERFKSGKGVTKLTGIPIGVKDILVTKGIHTTCGSKILANYVPPYTATAVKKLEDAGAVIVGKLNMDEFAMGSSNEYSAFGPVKNPVNEEYIPGGSSGGSAAAVTGGQCVATLGTDTGGSIRQPAAMCGVVGLKPTYGRVSRYGLTAFASSLDQIGPFANTVKDIALVLQAIAGHDPLDATSLDAPVPDYTKRLEGGVKGLKIGVPREYFVEGIDAEVEAGVRAAIDKLKAEGAEVVEISLPHTQYAIACYYIIAPAEASANLARFDGIRYGHRAKKFDDLNGLYEATRTEGFGPEVTLRIMVGTYVLSSGYYDAYYKKAQCVRTLITHDFAEAFKKVDVIATPTTPTTAFKFGEKTNDPLQMYLADIFTIPVNLAGLPGLSIPCGKDKKGLPIGLQLIGRHLDEETMLKAAYCYEQI
jgi:aspartyl-tRNA(Asn)/glutamyl-tRNA(Gln) amidotransferase subunit A